MSFDLHQELSDEHGGEMRWGYRRVSTVEVRIDESGRNEPVPGIDWIDGATRSE
jgi:hypothetical protein